LIIGQAEIDLLVEALDEIIGTLEESAGAG
jgi:hypothetical protein